MNVYHWENPGWSQLDVGGEVRGTVGGYENVEVDDVSEYSPFGLADGNPSAPTAVTVGDFVVIPDLNRMLMNWELIWEFNVSGFNLYRSESLTGEQAMLGFVPLQLSSTVYEFEDSSILSGKTYYYWLEVIGVDHSLVEILGPVAGRSDNLVWLPAVQK
jgi:hypothetical protein